MTSSHRLYRTPRLNRIRNWWVRWTLVLGLIGASSLSTHASDVLRFMPEDALGFVLVRDLADFDAKVSRFTQLFNLPVPGPLEYAKLATGLDQGLRPQGELLIALIPGPPELPAPQPMVLLPVNNYAQLAEAIHGDPSGEICRVSVAGEDVLIAKFDSYALLMNVEHRETMELLLGLQQAPVANLKPLDTWIASNDLIVAILPNGLEALLHLGGQYTTQQQELIANELDAPHFSPVREQMERNVELYQWVLDTLGSEIELAAFAVSLDDSTNLRISKRVLLNEESQFATQEGVLETSGSALGGFTNQPFVFAAGGPIPEKWIAPLASVNRKLMQQMPELYGSEEFGSDEWKKLEEYSVATMKSLKSLSMILLPGSKGEPLFSNVFGIAKTSDAEAYLESYSKAAELWNELMANSTSDISLEYQVSSRTVGGAEAREIVVDVAAAARDPNVPVFNWLLEAMFGGDGKMRQLLVAANQQTLVYGMAEEKQLLPVIDAAKNGELGLVNSSDVQVTMKLLPEQPSWTMLVSPQGCVVWAKRIAEEFLSHLIGETPRIPDFGTSPPLGMAVNLRDKQLEVDWVCPVETLQALAAYIEKCKAL
ncbi:MAG: hypothetical protein KDA57_14920 [Planctomycetales bacterium]|nr:hypothetical protein [Planctomycetales bacterium]